MMKERKMIPRKRFEGFCKKWERHLLKDKVEFITGLTYSPNDVTDSKGTLVIRSSNIKNNQIKDADNVYVNPNVVDSQKVKIGDIIVVVRNGSRHLIGKNAVVKREMPNTVIGAFMTGIRTRHYNYVGTLLNTRLFKKQVSENLGATINQITIGMFGKMQFYFPEEKEQQKIGEFFKVLDERIANQERKIAKVKALKEAYLTEMFPQEGETVPKRRFKGFEGEWEKRKISELFKVTRGDVLSTTKISKTRTSSYYYPVYSSQTLNNGLLGYYNKHLFDTAITWTTDGANAGTVNYREGKFYSTNVNGVLISTEGYACKAIAEALNLIAWKYVSKVGNPKLMNNVMSDIELFVPKRVKELELISNFFQNLDDQIRMEEAKLEKLKKMKEAYLEEMFV